MFNTKFKMDFSRFAYLLAIALLSIGALYPGQSLSADALANTQWAYGIVGDVGWLNDEAKELRTSLLDAQVPRLIMPGDNLYQTDKTYAEVWNPWHQAGFEFPVVAIGNHNDGYANEVAYFKMPAEYFAKTEGQGRFIILNSDNTATVPEQTAFLRRELQAAREKYIFVVFHHPPYTVGKHKWTEKQKFQLAIRPILNEYGERITALIVGHDHQTGIYSLNGLPMIVSGAGIETRPAPSDVNTEENDVKVQSLWVYSQLRSWARLTVDERTGQVRVDFVNLKNQTLCSSLISVRPVQMDSSCR